MTDQEQSIKPTLGEEITELYTRVAKLNDQTAALLNPAWGSETGIIPTDHPLYVAEKPPAAQQEQAAPVDWQAIAKQRERELKQVGEDRHRAEAAIARVRALADRWKRNGTRDLARYADIMLGELDHPGPEDTDTTPAELTAQEARDLADELSTDLYKAQDRLAFIAECLDAAEQGGSNAVEIRRVRLWLDGPKCGMQLVAENPGLYEKLTRLLSGPLPAPGDTPPAVALPCSHTHLRQPHAPHRWQPQPGMRHVQCPGWEHAPAATEAADGGDPDTRCGDPYRTEHHGVARCSRGLGHPGIHAGHADDGTTCQWPDNTATEATSTPDTGCHCGLGSKTDCATKPWGCAHDHGHATPATVTDPAWLRQQYASVIRRWWDADDGGAEEIAAAVLAVRDRHLQQLRQRLTLADHELQQWAAAESADAAAGSYALRAETAEQQRDQLAATLREILARFTDHGHPGAPCVRTPWLRTPTIDRWRAVLDQTQEQP